MASYMITGLMNAIIPTNLLVCLMGVVLGICFGALPGLSAGMGVALLIPLSYTMEPATGLILLAAVYCGATYGGSISAILLHTPGTVAAVMTSRDGYAMTTQGKGDIALTEAAVASGWGGLFSGIALLFISPLLAKISLKFGPQENIMLAVFGLSIIASMSSKNLVKGLIGGLFGLLIGTIGMDPQLGIPRYTFGSVALLSGVPLVPSLIGLYSIAQVISLILSDSNLIVDKDTMSTLGKYKIRLKDLFMYPAIYLKSGIIGTIVGIIPGTGTSIAAFLGYNQAQRASKHPEEFGKGSREAIAGAESANNAVTGGSIIPMLTLGIPGNSVTAILMGGLMIQGLYPGNALFTTSAPITYTFMMGFIIANLVMLAVALISARYFVQLVRVPTNFLAAGILVLTMIGAFAVANNMSSVWIMLVFGVLSYVLKQLKFDYAPIVLGMILGPMAEKGVIQTVTINKTVGATLTSFMTRPISLALIVLSVISVALPLVQEKRKEKKAAAES